MQLASITLMEKKKVESFIIPLPILEKDYSIALIKQRGKSVPLQTSCATRNCGRKT
jgi:hypothetical protein